MREIEGHKPQNILIKGQGIGRKFAHGTVVIAKNAEEAVASNGWLYSSHHWF